jgi:uncharacterized protein YjiS (DUF1127 family)
MTTIYRQPPQGLVHFEIPLAVSLAHYSVTARDTPASDRRHLGLRSALQRAMCVVGSWRQRACSRRRLLELDDHMLKDIGLTRSERFLEVSKPFWR